MTCARLMVAPLLLLGLACGSAGKHVPAGLADAAGSSGSASVTHAGDSSVSGSDAASGANAGGAGSTDDPEQPPAELGGDSSQELQVVEVPAGPATALDLTPHVFIPATDAFYVFDRAGVVGKRRFALDTASLALVTFDSDGTAPSSPLLDQPLAAAGRGDELVALELDDKGDLVSVTYDGELKHGTAPRRLAGPGSGAQALASSADQDVAVWSLGSQLEGRLLATQSAIGDGFDYGARSSGDHGCAARALWTGKRFAMLWTRANTGGENLLSWGTIDEQGATLSARNLLSAQTALHLEDVVALSDGRLAVLLTLGSPAQAPLLLFVDEFGTLAGAAHVYQGVTAAWTLASDGTTLLLSARSGQSQGVIRLLDATGEPRSDWLVVDDSAVASNFEPRVAVFTSDQGYAAVVRLTDGSSAVVDLDPASFPSP